MSADTPRARLIHAVNRVHDFRVVLSELTGERYYDGNYKIFCPFHEDRNSPSAQLYDNDMFCFTCWKKFSPYDVLVQLGRSEEELRKGLPEILPDAPVRETRPFLDPAMAASHILYKAGALSTSAWSALVADRIKTLRSNG